MSKVCEISGKRPIVANSIQRRGKAKREGGVGKKTTGISKRRQYPNLQKVRVRVAGQEITFRVAASHIPKVYELVERAKGLKLEGLSPRRSRRSSSSSSSVPRPRAGLSLYGARRTFPPRGGGERFLVQVALPLAFAAVGAFPWPRFGHPRLRDPRAAT